MGDVVDINCLTKLDIEPDKVLLAPVGKLKDCIVVGYDNEGGFYFASSRADGAPVAWLLNLALHKLMKIGNLEE